MFFYRSVWDIWCSDQYLIYFLLSRIWWYYKYSKLCTLMENSVIIMITEFSIRVHSSLPCRKIGQSSSQLSSPGCHSSTRLGPELFHFWIDLNDFGCFRIEIRCFPTHRKLSKSVENSESSVPERIDWISAPGVGSDQICCKVEYIRIMD